MNPQLNEPVEDQPPGIVLVFAQLSDALAFRVLARLREFASTIPIRETRVLHAPDALKKFIKSRRSPEDVDSSARVLAMQAYLRGQDPSCARDLGIHQAPSTPERENTRIARSLGIACVGAVQPPSNCGGGVPPMRMSLAIQSTHHTEVKSIILANAEPNSSGWTDEAERFLVEQLASSIRCESLVPDNSGYTTAKSDHSPAAKNVVASQAWRDLLHGAVACLATGGPPLASTSSGRVIFPGSFCPVHEGHVRMADLARRFYGSVEFEISIQNVDKPPLDYVEIATRVAQFAPEQTVWLTRAATFLEKARLFPNAAFLVGADTILRIADPTYYEDSAARDAAIATIASLGCRFIVFGRLSDRGFESLDDLALPAPLRQLCVGHSEMTFRCDVSSTEIRQSRRTGPT